jgi:hypothetical protein
MNAGNNSLLVRLARWQVRALVRVWPEESRRWGQALASEAEEIEQPLQAVAWAAGGVTVYLRALGSHVLAWFKLPVGERSSAGLGPLMKAPGPKRSRLFTAVLLAGAVGLLCIPEGREAITTLRATWENFAELDPDQKTLEKIAERAVELDPHLFWIYEVQRFGQEDEQARREWAARAEAVDPDNAVPYLLAAGAIAQEHYYRLFERHSPTEKEVDDVLTGDAEWMALMNRAFHATRYDSYYREHKELIREVWRREPQLSFVAAIGGLWAHAIPALTSLATFTEFLIRQSEQARAAGHMDKAEDLLREADDFSRRMQQDSTQIGRRVGLSLERQAALGWKAFYEGTGQAAEARAAAQRVAQIEQRIEFDMDMERHQIFRNRTRGDMNAWFLEISAILMIFAALFSILGIGSLEVRPSIWKRKPIMRRVLCWATDLAPATVLASCVVFLVSFLPFAHLFAAYRSGNPGAADEQQLSAALWSLEGVPLTIAGGVDTAVLGWTALTVVLSLVLALLLAGMVYRARRAAAPQM